MDILWNLLGIVVYFGTGVVIMRWSVRRFDLDDLDRIMLGGGVFLWPIVFVYIILWCVGRLVKK